MAPSARLPRMPERGKRFASLADSLYRIAPARRALAMPKPFVSSFPIPRTRLLLCLLLAVVVALGGCARVESLSWHGADHIIPDGQVEMLRDRSGRLGIDDVAVRGTFQPVASAFNLGYTPDTVWLRLHLDRMGALPRVLMLQVDAPLADTVRLYLPQDDGTFREIRRGEDVSHRDYPYLLRTPVFQLESPQGRYPTVYLRLTERNAMTVAVKLWEPQALLAQETLSASQSSVFLGFVIALCLAGAFIWRRSRVGPVRWYVAYIATSAYSVYKTRGLVGPFFYLDLADGGDALLGVVLALSVAVAVSFSVRLMSLRTHFPRATRAYETLVWAVIACACVGFLLGRFGTVMPVVQLLSLGSAPLLLGAAAYLAVRGEPMARLYLVAFSLLYVAFCRVFLVNLGLLPDTPFMRGGGPLAVGLTLHLLILTFSFAQRVHKLERERQEAQQQALDAARLAEASLERKVRQRTRELDEEIAQRQVTERMLRENQMQLEQALATEQQMREEQREFVMMVSHEFRTPLAIIHASGQMLRETETALASDSQRRVEKIQTAAERMSDFIDRFLDNERLLSERHALTSTTFPLERFVADSLDVVDPSRERIEVDLAQAPASLTCDRGFLRVVLDNLLTNALKYSPPGAPVRLRVSGAGEAVTIGVTDEGPGIPSSEHASVFLKFARGGASRGTTGAGLGLYLVKRIVARMGGEIELRSPTGTGATFTVHLPAAGAVGGA
ncbi:MAG: ATP-binding protein [Dyella sp.]|uniref:sensor histidine kinase n=1 Tax=Dyella sp. TaxID=1869338 RepID=UPI003F80099C